jgi:hypothetical protein
MSISFHRGTIIIIIIIIIIRGATAMTNLGRLSSRRWQSFPTAPDGTGLTCGQHIESHTCIFSFPNRTVTSLFKQLLSLSDHEAEWTPFRTQLPQKNPKECPGIEPGTSVLVVCNANH